VQKVILLFLVSASVLFANEDDSLIYHNYKIGVFGSYNLNFHDPDFKELPGIPNCCPRFNEGNGTGFSVGALFEYLFSEKMNGAARLSYTSDGGLLTGYDYDYVNYRNSITLAKIRHELDVTLDALALDLLFQYNFFDRFYVHAGPRLAFLLVHDYSQIELLKDPPDGSFENGARYRNNTSGTINETTALLAYIQGGISYELPLNRQQYLFLCPEVFYSFPLNDIVSDSAWKFSQLRIGMALKYRPYELPVERRLERKVFIDTVKYVDDSITASVFIMGVADTARDVEEFEKLVITHEKVTRTDTLLLPEIPPEASMKITIIPEPYKNADSVYLYKERYFVTEMLPLIPFVFYGKDSSDIPQRYFSDLEPQDFSRPEYDLNPVMIQRNILKILGARLKQYPDITLTLTGTADKNAEKGNCRLATDRAENLKSIFTKEWGVDESRIAVSPPKSKCVPKNPTLSNNEDGNNDNRRVEINSSDDIRLFAPIVRKRLLKEIKLTTSKTNDIKEIFLENSFKGTTTGKGYEYRLTATQDGNVLFNKSDTSVKSLEMVRLTEDKIQLLRNALPIEMELSVRSPRGKTASYKTTVPVRIDSDYVEVQRFSLTYFTVSWDSLSSKEVKEFNELMKGIREQPNVSVIGYTDYLGDPKINVQLSTNRAKAVAEYIKNYIPGTNIIRNEGVADSVFPPGIRSYSTPEERFLSRTVQIEFRISR